MIFEPDNKVMMPSLEEVIAALTIGVPPPQTFAPSLFKVVVKPIGDGRLPRPTFTHPGLPIIYLAQMRYTDAFGQKCMTWAVTDMPKFHL